MSMIDGFRTVRPEGPGVEESDLPFFAPSLRAAPVRIVRSSPGPAPAWVDHVLRQARDLLTTRPDWNGHGAPAIEPELVLVALEELATFMPADAIPPVVGPTVAGGVQFEWHAGGWDVEVEILGEGHTEAWGEQRESGEYWEGELSAVRERLVASLERLSFDARLESGGGT